MGNENTLATGSSESPNTRGRKRRAEESGQKNKPNLSIRTDLELDPTKIQGLVSQLSNVQTSSVMKTPNGTVLTPTTRANKHVQLVLALLVRAAELLSLDLSDPETYAKIPELLKDKVPDSVYNAVQNMAGRYARALNQNAEELHSDQSQPSKRRKTPRSVPPLEVNSNISGRSGNIVPRDGSAESYSSFDNKSTLSVNPPMSLERSSSVQQSAGGAEDFLVRGYLEGDNYFTLGSQAYDPNEQFHSQPSSGRGYIPPPNFNGEDTPSAASNGSFLYPLPYQLSNGPSSNSLSVDTGAMASHMYQFPPLSGSSSIGEGPSSRSSADGQGGRKPKTFTFDDESLFMREESQNGDGTSQHRLNSPRPQWLGDYSLNSPSSLYPPSTRAAYGIPRDSSSASSPFRMGNMWPPSTRSAFNGNHDPHR